MKKLKQIKYTLLIYCEGKTDYLFIKHLKGLYLVRGSKHITLKKGTGGGVFALISSAFKISQNRDYDEKYIVLDSDHKTNAELKELEEESKYKNIKLKWQKPCLEGLFLQILEKKSYTTGNSQMCKDLFYKKYNQDRKVFTNQLLNNLFPKITLDQSRQKVPELDQLIKLMEST